MRCMCGYGSADHDQQTGQCPLCACGAMPGEHVGEDRRCPGKGADDAGVFPALRRGRFREPAEESVPEERPVRFPPPEHTSRDPWPEEVVRPRAVLRVEREAAECGVATLAQYSRGWGTHATHGRPTSLCHMIGLRFRRTDGAVAYGVYVRPVAGRAPWKWQSIRTPDRKLTLTELSEWMATSHL